MIKYKSTRNDKLSLSASEAIIKGLSDDGGLFIPNEFPKLDVNSLYELSYNELAEYILGLYLGDYSKDEIKKIVNSSYDDRFDIKERVAINKVDNRYYLELFHGSTLAFKDMALSILPNLMTYAKKKCGISDDILILTATSGDTGKAAMEGFKNVEGTRIVVFYPDEKVSKVQALQMKTQDGNNVHVAGIKGNFDDAQGMVKKLFNDNDFVNKVREKGYLLSSANSINIGRLLPQVIYYVYAYLRLDEKGLVPEEGLNVVVPTGNFGNILACYYGKMMGLNINKLVVASNKNNVLTDFFETGIYDRNREFYITSSPSMDILVSSNVERLLYHLCEDTSIVKECLENLNKNGRYEFNNKLFEDNGFMADFSDETEILYEIKRTFKDGDYLIDPHTAVASRVGYKLLKDDTFLVASTASIYKFPNVVLEAVNGTKMDDDFDAIDKLYELGKVDVPKNITKLREADIIHNSVIDKNEMGDFILNVI